MSDIKTNPLTDIDHAFNTLFRVAATFPSNLLSTQNFITYLVNCQVWLNNATNETAQLKEQQEKIIAMRDEKVREIADAKANNESGFLAT